MKVRRDAPRRLRFVSSPGAVQSLMASRAPAPSIWPELFATELRLEKAFADAGGLLVVGSDPTGAGGALAGFANLRSLELLVDAGFTIPEAVRVGTLNGAVLLGLDEKGVRAVLVAVIAERKLP